MSTIEGDSFDPYALQPGRELDAYIHHIVLRSALASNYPFYSTSTREADLLKKAFERRYQLKMVVGKTTVPGKSWFARYEMTTGNPTEVLAESYPLAICRLTVLRSRRA